MLWFTLGSIVGAFIGVFIMCLFEISDIKHK